MPGGSFVSVLLKMSSTITKAPGVVGGSHTSLGGAFPAGAALGAVVVYPSADLGRSAGVCAAFQCVPLHCIQHFHGANYPEDS